MVELIVDSVSLDTFGDENISMTVRQKDARDIDKLFTDYTNTFSLPASKTNNKVFKHYYNFNAIGGFDARIKIPARLDIDTVTFRRGMLRLDSCSLKQGKIDTYKCTFYGEAVNLSDLFGEFTLPELNWSEYDHARDDTTVTDGLDATKSLFNDEIIYPLITKNNQWTKAQLQDSATVDPIEFSPAIQVVKVFDKISDAYGVTFNSDLFAEAHFQKLYLWCPRELGDDDVQAIDPRGNEISFDSATGDYVTDIYSYDTGIIDLRGFYVDGWKNGSASITTTPSTGDTYTLRMYGYVNGLWELHDEVTTSGTQTNVFLWDDTDNYDQIRFYINSLASFTTDVDIDIDYSKGGNTSNAFDITTTALNIDNYDKQFKYRIPSMKIIDFFRGIMRLFNMMITPVSATEFNLEPFDVWKADGRTGTDAPDLTDRLDMTKGEVITPKLPKLISYKYAEPKAINNARYNEIFGIGYGDLEAKTTGGDSDKNIEVEFENLMWDKLDASSLNVGFAFEKPNEGYEDGAFLMYWAANTTENINLDLPAPAITSYKMCHTYYPATSPTHSLNFGSEINTYDATEETASLFDNYHRGYIETIFHEALRIHRFDMYMPAHVMSDIQLNDVVKIHDVYYNINSMTMGLTTGKVSIELVNFIRELSTTVPPTDTDPPTVGDLAIVGNPDTTAPTIGTLSYNEVTGTSIRLNWTAATDDVGVVQYDIYQDTVLIRSIAGTVLTANITGLANNTEYDFYIKAWDAAGNESSASNTVSPSTNDVNAPVITSPTLVWWYEPDFVEYQITATNSPDLYGATGLPSFLNINTGNGIISGNIDSGDVGIYSFNVRASNTAGASWGDYKEITVEIF